MIELFIYFVVFYVVAFVWGHAIPIKQRMVQLNLGIYALLGLLNLSLIGLILLSVTPLDWLAMFILLGLTLLLYLIQKKEIILHIKDLWTKLQNLGFISKSTLLLLLCAVAYQGAQPTRIHDTGAYYQQTILWMQQVGLVKGVANLYPPFGLFSAWHGLAALLDPNNLGLSRMHQVNGLLYLSFLILLVFEIKNSGSRAFVFISCIAMCLGFFYLTGPSPDLPSLLYPIFLVWLIGRFTPTDLAFILPIIAIVLFAIKPPAFAGLAFVSCLLLAEPMSYKRFSAGIGIGFLLLVIICYKGIILSGYPLYPSAIGDWFQVDWKVPTEWNQLYRKGIASWGSTDKDSLRTFSLMNQSVAERFFTWLTRGGYKGLMNQLIFLNWLLALFYTAKGMWRAIHSKKSLEITDKFQILFTSTCCMISLLEWYLLNQYRLMLPTALVLGYLNLKQIEETKGRLMAVWKQAFDWVHKWSLQFLLFFMLLLILVPFSIFTKDSRNQRITSNDGFNTSYLISPWIGFKTGVLVDSLETGYLNHYDGFHYCWDCPLPCQTVSHRKILAEQMHLQVEWLDTSLSSGFKLTPIKNEDLPTHH